MILKAINLCNSLQTV